jgi:integrase/recombinase XerD
MKRSAIPALSDEGQQALDAYTAALHEYTDTSTVTVRNYRSELRQFIAWCERTWAAGQEQAPAFVPTALTTPLITRYRTYLQHTQRLKPASVNRALVSIKRYAAWALDTGQIRRNVAAPVKLIPTEKSAPRHLDDTEEEALVAAVTATGSLRDQTIIILLLHTGLRARELCTLHRDSVAIGRRSGFLRVYGKRNKYREVPFRSMPRRALP